MENLNLANWKLSKEYSKDIIELIVRKRNLASYKRK